MCDRFPSLAAKRRAVESAQAVIANLDTEEEVLQHLLDTKPTILGCGQEIHVDKAHIEEHMKGYVERFRRHGQDDRSSRLDYLQSVLRKKWSAEPQNYLSMMGLLYDMRIDPTREYNTSTQMSSRIYSSLPDSSIKKENDDEQSLADEQLKKEILEEISQEQLLHPIPQFSDDTDLSDWSSSDTEEGGPDDDIPTVIPKSDSTNNNKDIPESTETTNPPPLDEEALKLSWRKAGKEAMAFLQGNVRQLNLVKLTSQPVISNIVDLQLLFGQYWEWRESHKRPDGGAPNLQVILETDVIREILWHLSCPNTVNSPVFTNDWNLNPNIMISTLSQSTLRSIVEKYGKISSILENLRRFIRSVEMNSSGLSEEDTNSVPKVFQVFAAGLTKILMEISTYVGFLENETFVKKTSCTDQSLLVLSSHNSNSHVRKPFLMVASEKNPVENQSTCPLDDDASTTLLQLDRKLRDCVLILRALENIFVQSIGDLHSSVQFTPSSHWLMSIKLISTLEMALSTESNLKIWRLTLFLFSNCLHAYLDEFLSPLETLEWSDGSSLFSRNWDAHINDSNFWTNSIKIQPYKKKMAEINIVPLSCLEEAVPKMLSILKTLEMLRQLDEDFTVILGQLPSAKSIAQEFLGKIMPVSSQCHHTSENYVENKAESVQSVLDYQRYFDFLPLHNNFVLSSFNSILKNEVLNQSKSNQNNFSQKNCDFSDDYNDILSFENFIKCEAIPYAEIKHTLCSVFQTFLNPVVSKAHHSLGKIFHDYKVDESMTIFREIILGAREDFAQSVVRLATTINTSSRFTYEDPTSRDPLYQQLLIDCYPEGRESFDIQFHLDPKSDMNCKFIVTPKFPVNLILSEDAINGYLNVSKQLHRIRKSLWTLNNLQMKECKTIEGVELNRAFLLRFALIHFCSSLRAFFMLKVFANNYNVSTVSTVQDADLDQIIKAHEAYLQKIELRLLKIKLMDSIIIKKMVIMSEGLSKTWHRGISMKNMITLEDCLKKCWSVVNDFSRSGCSTDFNELYYHLGPPPSYL